MEPTDDRLTSKTRVVGIDLGGERIAITRDRLSQDGVTHMAVGGRARPSLVAWAAGFTDYPSARAASSTRRRSSGEPLCVVAAYACNPDHATEWYANITEVKWKSPKPVAVGSLVESTAKFLGRRLVYTYEIAEFVPATRFVMRTADGPFPMVTTYEFTDAGAEATRMTLRNAGAPGGFAKIAARGMERAMRSANKKDLQRLKEVLEASPSRR